MFKRLVLLSLLLCFSISVSGCATVMGGTTQKVGISSTPSGALVRVNGVSQGKTPLIANLRRKDNHMVKIELEGYEPYETTLTRHVSGWIWGNIIVGGLIGLGIDALTGGLYKLTPTEINAELRRQGISRIDQEDTLCVAVVLKPDPSWQKIGSLKPIRAN